MSKYITRKKALFFTYFLLTLLASAGSIGFAFVLSEVIDQAAAGNMRGLLMAIGCGVLFLTVSVSCEYLYDRTLNRLLYHAVTSLKNDLYRAYFRKKTTDYDRVNSAQYINEITNNVKVFSDIYFTNVLQLPMVCLVFAAAVVLCLVIEPAMLFVIVAFSLVTLFVSKRCGQILQKSTEASAGGAERYLSVMKDDFGGYRLIRAYNRTEAFAARHKKENAQAERLNEKNSNDRSMYARVNELLGLASTLTIMGVAGIFAVNGSFEIGIVFAFGQLAGKIMAPIMQASGIYVQFQSAKALSVKFAESLRAGSADSGKPVKKAGLDREITVRGLRFSYPADTRQDMALDNQNTVEDDKVPAATEAEDDKVPAAIENEAKKYERVFAYEDMTVRKGGKYLITGRSGAGKSTLLHLLAGMYDDYAGDLKYDDAQVRDIEEESMHAMVSVVSQEAFLFNDTLKNNLTLYDDRYQDEDIRRALRLAGLEELVKKLSEKEDGADGLETVVSENGGNFSGGEKRRINLARAVLRKSPVLLIDEFTAGLDEKTAEEVERAVLDLENVTILFVTHQINEKLAQYYDARFEIGG